MMGKDYILPNYRRVTLENYSGLYEDVYNNYFVSQSLTTIIYEGAAIYYELGENSKGIRIVIFTNAYCGIGNNLSTANTFINVWFGANVRFKNSISVIKARIFVTAFSDLYIGNDVMMSDEEMIYTGDGHAIFEMQEDGKYKHVNECTNDKIVIGEHVWIGYACKILNGARIGDGSIIGAGSLVNKKFPNNVVIVGSPAKVVRKNIAWTRNVLIQELERDEYVYKNYANKTVIE